MRKNLLFLNLLVALTGATMSAKTTGETNSDSCTNNGTEPSIEQNCASEANGFMFNEDVVLIDNLSNWKYNDNGVDLGTSWKDLAYDDASWASGNAILGYGDGVETTTLSYGSDSSNKYPTYYFRKSFQVADASEYLSLFFGVVKDDGVVVYLNGTEVNRLNMPDGTITYNTYASSAMGGSNESAIHNFEVANLLQDGENVIAVELHQADASSSDLRFDLKLEGHVEIEPLDPATYPLPMGSAWNYLDDGTDQATTGWNDFPYNYDSWARGYAALGYGDPVSTEVSFGPDSNNKYITTYFTRDIDITLSEVADNVRFGIKRDDGAVVYVNGVEVFRDNMPEGPIDYLTHSSSIVSSNDENTYFTHELPKTIFVDGVNRIAVEIHNRDQYSSDLKFDMYIEDVIEYDTSCDTPHIGCFTSIVPTGQIDRMIIPQGHRFQMILKQGTQYTDGSGNIPGNHDFTAYVPANGSSEQGYLSINHENTPGGVTIANLHLDTDQLLWQIDSSEPVDFYNDALVTTTRNCSGGITPWGTVITSEESTNSGDANNDGYDDVGWHVEIDPVTAQVVDYGNGQEKLWAMGRMNHENIVVTEDGTTAYYGEDGGTHCFYKFVADTPGDLSEGSVYVLKLDLPLSDNEPSSSTAEWIQVPNDTPADRNNIRNVAAALGGTNFNGVEDAEISPLDGKIYFAAKGRNRVYRFNDDGDTVSGFETFVGGMTYSIETTQGTYNEPWASGNDNLTFDDKGNLWVLQDGSNNYIWVVRPDHTQNNPNVELFAAMPAGAEPTGLTFTPDYKYGFFSVQHPSGNNSPQQDATFGDVTFNASATVVFALEEDLGLQAPQADFIASEIEVLEGETVTFTDLSTNSPDSWMWTFEGGEPATSTEETPSVTYANSGTYNVSLVTSNIAGSSAEVIKSEYIIVSETASVGNNVLANNVSLYPNPTKGNINVMLKDVAGKKVSVEVYDLLGRSLYQTSQNEVMSGTEEIRLDLSEFAQANQMYIIQVTVGDKSARYKVYKTD